MKQTQFKPYKSNLIGWEFSAEDMEREHRARMDAEAFWKDYSKAPTTPVYEEVKSEKQQRLPQWLPSVKMAELLGVTVVFLRNKLKFIEHKKTGSIFIWNTRDAERCKYLVKEYRRGAMSMKHVAEIYAHE